MTLHKRFITLSLPNIISNLTVPLAGIIDLALLGHLQDIAPLAGVALGTIIFDYIYWSFGFLRMGTTGITATAFGKQDQLALTTIAFRGLGLAATIGVLLLALKIPIGELSFSLLQGAQSVEHSGKAYFDARIWAAPATLALYVINGWFLGMHRSGTVLILAILLNGANIIFDTLFIYSFGWGAAGAGYATMLSVCLTAVAGLSVLLFSLKSYPRPSLSMLFNKKETLELISLNINLLIRTFLLITVFALFTNISSLFGTLVLAANTIALKLISVGAYFIDGFAFALEAMAGKFYGEKDGSNLLATLKLSLWYCLGSILLFTLGIMVAHDSIISLFASSQYHPEVISLTASYTPFIIVALIAAGSAYIFDGFFIGMARGDVLRKSMILSSLLGFIPLATLSVYFYKPELLWGALILFMIMRSISLATMIGPTIRCASE
ncbi:MAG: MATE family efflux transporter [Fibrobacterales bacterium]